MRVADLLFCARDAVVLWGEQLQDGVQEAQIKF